MIGEGVDYREPQTAEEVCALLDELGDDGRIMAGGTAVVLLLHQRLMAPACLINIHGLPELAAITWLVFVVWVSIGLLVYFGYGMRHSKLAGQ